MLASIMIFSLLIVTLHTPTVVDAKIIPAPVKAAINLLYIGTFERAAVAYQVSTHKHAHVDASTQFSLCDVPVDAHLVLSFHVYYTIAR